MKELIEAIIEAVRGAFAPQPERKPVPVRAEKPRNRQTPWKGRT